MFSAIYHVLVSMWHLNIDKMGGAICHPQLRALWGFCFPSDLQLNLFRSGKNYNYFHSRWQLLLNMMIFFTQHVKFYHSAFISSEVSHHFVKKGSQIWVKWTKKLVREKPPYLFEKLPILDYKARTTKLDGPHSEGTCQIWIIETRPNSWDPNYSPGVDFLDHNFLSSKNLG